MFKPTCQEFACINSYVFHRPLLFLQSTACVPTTVEITGFQEKVAGTPTTKRIQTNLWDSGGEARNTRVKSLFPGNSGGEKNSCLFLGGGDTARLKIRQNKQTQRCPYFGSIKGRLGHRDLGSHIVSNWLCILESHGGHV